MNQQNNIVLDRKEAPAPGRDEGLEQALLIVGWVIYLIVFTIIIAI